MAKQLLPAQFDQMFAEARQAVVSGEFAKASKLFATLIKAQPENCDVLFACATLHLSLNDDRNATLFLKEIINLKPDHVGAHHDLAMVNLRASRYEEALQEIEKAHEIDPNEPHVIALKANLLLKADRHDEAYAIIKPAINNNVSSLKIALVFAS